MTSYIKIVVLVHPRFLQMRLCVHVCSEVIQRWDTVVEDRMAT